MDSVNQQFGCGVFGPDYDKVLESCLDSEDPIDLQDLANNQHPDVDGIEKVGEQLYRVLCHYVLGKVKTLLLEPVMAMKPIGSFVGDGTPPRAGGKETSYGPS